MYYKIDNCNDYLMHHGRQGQKWGVRNGPPYPLQGKFASSQTRYEAYMSEKKKQKILNDPKKLYKNRSKFTREEIEEAVRKNEAVNKLKNQMPQKKKKSTEKPLPAKKLALVDTPSKFVKNQKFLTKEEQEKAIEYLRKQEEAKRIRDANVGRKLDLVSKVGNVAKSVQEAVSRITSLVDMSRKMKGLSFDETHKLAVIEKLKNRPDGEKLLKALKIDYSTKEDKKDDKKDNKNNKNDNNNTQTVSGSRSDSGRAIINEIQDGVVTSGDMSEVMEAFPDWFDIKY